MVFQNKSFFEDGMEAGGESSIIFLNQSTLRAPSSLKMQTTTKPTIQVSETKGEKASAIFECKTAFTFCKKSG